MTKTGHNKLNSREYQTWWGIKQKCYDSKCPTFARYGALGATMCDQWLEFANFLNDMGSRPIDCNTVLRIDESLPYVKENCKWGISKRGRPINPMIPLKKRSTPYKKVNKPKTLCITIEQDHFDFIHSQAIQMTKEKGEIVNVNDLIRQVLQTQMPCPKLWDIFGGAK